MNSDLPMRRRNAPKTRRAILEAAQAVIAAQGAAAPLSLIAEEAGVTKGGLLHHFPSREALIRELGIASIMWFREAVADRVDLSENAPGKLLRAYVRTICDAIEGAAEPSNSLSLWLALSTEPSMAAVLSDDIDYWDRELARDGLDAATIAAVQMAADGVNVMAVIAPERARSRVTVLRQTLLEQTQTS